MNDSALDEGPEKLHAGLLRNATEKTETESPGGSTEGLSQSTFGVVSPSGGNKEQSGEGLNEFHSKSVMGRDRYLGCDLTGQTLESRDTIEPWRKRRKVLKELMSDAAGKPVSEVIESASAISRLRDGTGLEALLKDAEALDEFATNLKAQLLVTTNDGAESLTLDELTNKLNGRNFARLNDLIDNSDQFTPRYLASYSDSQLHAIIAQSSEVKMDEDHDILRRGT